MNNRSRILLAALMNCLVPIGVLTASSNPLGPAPADLVLIHGKVITQDINDSIAQAVAVRGGKIVAVGSDSQIMALVGKATSVIDVKGWTTTPGLIDTHIHASMDGYEETYGVNLRNVRSIKEAVEIVKTRVAQLKPGEWLHGEGWDEAKLAEKRLIVAADLDPVSPNNPVWLMQTSTHYAVANSYAMRLANLNKDTADPPAGTVDRDPKGNPDGILKESAMDLVWKLVPAPSLDQQRQSILRVMGELHQEGMTAIKDPWIDAPVWDAYQSLVDSQQLDLDVCVLWRADATLESAKKALHLAQTHPQAPQSLGDGRLSGCGAKLFMDGSGGARTAWMYQPWFKNETDVDGQNTGYPAESPEIYRQQVRLFHQAGVPIGTHAIGDRAIDMVVDTYAAVLKEKPTRGLRHALIHGNVPTEHAIAVIAELEKKYDSAIVEAQPEFLWWIGDLYAANFGVERRQRLFPMRTYEQKGILWTGGSDFGVTPLPARFGMWAALTRETLNGSYGFHPFGTEQTIDIHQALRAYTRAAARQLFLENRIGSIEVGKDADLAVWDRDLYSVPPEAIKDMKCEMTLFRGKLVYRSTGAR